MAALKRITQPPSFLSPDQAESAQQSTPHSFASLPPVLRYQLDGVRIYLCPTPSDAPPCFHPYQPSKSTTANGTTGQHGGEADDEHGDDDGEEAGITSAADGSLWLTESEVSFLSSSQGAGFSVSYPVISLHAVTRSPPTGLAPPTPSSQASGSIRSASSAGCLYLQLDLSVEDENVEEDDETSLLEMHIFTPNDESLDQLFEALSQCASLHPSAGGASGDGSHPFSGFAPFGTGAADAMAVDGAFDDADEEEDDHVVTDVQAAGADDQGELSEAGRRNLAHLESVMIWPEENGSAAAEGAAEYKPPSSPTATVAGDLASMTTEPRAEPTNTLILSHLPIEFFVPSICSALLSLLNAYGPLVRWIPLPTAGRAVVVFEEVEGAKLAKDGLDRLLLPFEDEASAATPGQASGAQADELRRLPKDEQLDESILRAVFGPTVSSEEAEPSTLSVPTSDKNFLISPPGSPPVGWEPIREDPPNRDTLADDLIQALGELRDTQSHIESHQPRLWGAEEIGTAGPSSSAKDDAESGKDQGRHMRGASIPAAEIILAPSTAPALRSYQPAWLRPSGSTKNETASQERDENGMIQVPGVTVQSFDPVDDGEADGEGGGGVGGRGAAGSTTKPTTHMGFTISSVKATVDSMRSPTMLAQQERLEAVPALDVGLGVGAGGGEGGSGRRITPTGRPPLNG